ncbi:GNAT family N-acetyltransferase [Natrialbaceae archaeon A-gly3]
MNRHLLDRLREVHPIEDLFFKRRVVFAIDDESRRERAEDDRYEIVDYHGRCGLEDLPDATRAFLAEHVGLERTARRLERADCSLHVAVDAGTGDCVGFGWSLVAGSQVVWHDNVPVPAGCGLVFHAVVDEDHRRRGLHTRLLQARHDWLFRECERVYTVVERRNTASMTSIERFGYRVVARNYLLKLFSVNVVSVLVAESVSAHLVLGKDSL